MSEVITDKDKEYEAREEANAPGADQAMSDRVNNRSLRPNSSAFIDFMKTGWDASEPEIEPLESSKFTPARLAALGKAFPGERLVIPAGSPKVPCWCSTLSTRIRPRRRPARRMRPSCSSPRAPTPPRRTSS